MTEPLDYCTALDRLIRLAEHPQAGSVCAAMRQEAPRGTHVPSDNTVAGWAEKGIVPRRDDELKLFLAALQRIARQRRPDAVLPFPAWPQWQRLAHEARQQRRTGKAGQRAATATTPPPPDWARDVTGASVWDLVRPKDVEHADVLRTQGGEFAGRLAAAYDRTRAALADDPWLDHGSGARMTGRTNRIVHHLWDRADGFLEPAEAALIALLPFLHQTHRARTALELREVNPTDLGKQPAPGELRRMYEMVVLSHARLTRRAEMGALKDRTDGRPEIGWWLFHQWVRRQPGRIGELLPAPGDLDHLGAVLRPDLLHRLLSCAQTGPHELFDPTRADHLRADPFDLESHDGRTFQAVRERLAGPLFALAHHLAIEATDLPSVLVRHIGIPDALDLSAFLTTVATASWQFARAGVALKASCSHPAAVAALTEHARSLEPLLRSVRDSGAPELRELPLYTRTEDVREVDATGRPVAVGGVIRFRVDEERVQELLMGENLYRDRSLAIRELYQNALDACRYRRARAQAADRFSSYEGRIEFVQGWDEEEGRHYLECRDNGVGMDELTLSEVFSQAGIRFTDLPRYQEERQEWLSRGVTMHPNSRFGIGVLSYFMLADEIRVTTCHMDAVRGGPREITVLITGPGHYFRVRPTDRPGTIGTTVRLYPREGDRAPSCVRELRRLLGIAEFATTAVHGARSASWEAGAPRAREALALRTDGYNAHGRLVPWTADSGSQDGQVVWCRHGGGLLVDGIHSEPRARHGILSCLDQGRELRGVIVNLAGASRPQRLSVDRTEILDDDVCVGVERLVRGALPALLAADPPLLDAAWLTEVAARSPRLADIVTEAARAADYPLTVCGRTTSMAVTGFFPADPDILSGRDITTRKDRSYAQVADATRLWRLLAHRPHPTLTALTEVVPELDEVQGVLPALPSDALLHARRIGDGYGRPFHAQPARSARAAPGFALCIADTCGISYREVIARLRVLHHPVPDQPCDDPPADEINLALLSAELTGVVLSRLDPLRHDRPVPPGHLLKAHVEFGITVSEAARRLRAFGFTTPSLAPSAEDADETALRLLSVNLDGKLPWLSAGTPVSPGHLIKAHQLLGLDPRLAADLLRSFGLTVVGEDALADRPESWLRLLGHGSDRLPALHPGRPVSAARVLTTAMAQDLPPEEVARKLRALGFKVETTAAHERLTGALLSESETWGWSTDVWGRMNETKSVAPGLLLVAASRCGVTVRDMADRVEALGFARPPVPPRPERTDTELLRDSWYKEIHPWLEAGSTVSVSEIAAAARRTGLPPAAVVDRMRRYGLVTPDTPMPSSVRHYDADILEDGHRSVPVSPDHPVPLSQVLRASHELGLSPKAIAERLAEYGLPVQEADLPGEPDVIDVRLVDQYDIGLDKGSPIPLYEILHVASRSGLDGETVAAQVSALGFEIRGGRPADADATDLLLCTSSEPRNHNSSPLALRDPLPDFIGAVQQRESEGGVDDLVPRLRRLGVDLDRLRNAVLTALSKVPGLVRRT